jgi:hypothetical protein
MMASWTALEDVAPGTGELEYYVGSHRLTFKRMDDTEDMIWIQGSAAAKQEQEADMYEQVKNTI